MLKLQSPKSFINMNNSHIESMKLNSNSFTNNDLSDFLQCSQEIEAANRSRRQRNKSSRHSSLKRPRKTREEIFEVSTLDEEAFMKTLASNDVSNMQQLKNLDLTRSIENLMKYFDEDVTVDEAEIEKHLSEKNEINENILRADDEQRKLYNSPVSTPSRTPVPRASSPKFVNAIKESQFSFINDCKNNLKRYEENSIKKSTTMSPKIQKIAEMFNKKLNSPRNSLDKSFYTAMEKRENTVSKNLDNIKVNKREQLKPTPKERTIFDKSNEIGPPKAPPRRKSKNLEIVQADIVIAQGDIEKPFKDEPNLEEEFDKNNRTVKDKILLFNRFFEKIANRSSVDQKKVSPEKLNVSQNLNLKNNNSKKSKRPQSTAIKNIQKIIEEIKFKTKSKKNDSTEVQNLSSTCNRKATVIEMNENFDNNEDEIHMSSLTVFLQTSLSPIKSNQSFTRLSTKMVSPAVNIPANKTSTIKKSPNKTKQFKSQNEIEFEALAKRNNHEIRTAIPLEVYGPPKKIRKTKMERKKLFENHQIESMFCEWLMWGHKFQALFHSALESNSNETNNESDNMPPENELQKSHDNTAALSEHQLRVQASLQRLNIPDWYRAYSSTPKPIDGQIGYKPGNFTRKRASESGRWTGLNSKTTSLSSLGSQRSDRSPLLLSPSAHSHHGTTHTQGGVNSGTHVNNQSGGFSRWSTSHLNSTQTSPSVSQRGSFSRGGPINSSFSSAAGVAGGSIRNSFRQPYMGWRSQEKINQPRTPHERLASSILAHKPPKPESVTAAANAASAVTPEIQSSIKEVTSAIVHYVNDQNRTAPSRSRSTSPNSRKCWLESSFVGVRPLESPQTPTLENNSFSTAPQSIQQNNSSGSSTGHQQQYHLQNYSSDILRVNGVGVSPLTSLSLAPERSPSSASLEDVLASLLGLPTESSSSYRSTGDTASEIIMFRVTQPTAKHQQQQKLTAEITTATAGCSSSLQVEQQNRLRRRSEGDAQRQKQQQQEQQQKKLSGQINISNDQQQQALSIIQQSDNNSTASGLLQQPTRRVSLDSSESKTTSELLIKCRNTKCDQTSNPVDAKKYYKSCHNCSHMYCSRECRRAHWEKHRKACLHSRVSNLCRQVLSACKDDVDTLRHLSLLARKGYLSQGRGVVRILFRSPEAAEGFIKNGFQCMGEASYVRWPDLMPAEMGLELYSELLRLSTEYKTDTKMLLYVAICVVSEAPGSATAPVKWERQLVSRCAKLKLCKSILNEFSDQNQQNNIQQQQIAPESSTEILILTFNLQTAQNQREIILQNILSVLNRRGVILKKHYPEIYQRLQTFADGQTERFMPVTLHPRDSQTGQGFVCIIMPNELIQLPTSDIGNRVCTIDVGEELLES